MLIDNLNINNLRVFEVVYKNGSMTKAAEELCIGQSAVSQHMRNLEDLLEVKLFDRIKNKLLPTHNAKELYDDISKSFQDIEMSLRRLKGIENILIGRITIGLPLEFGNNIIIPLLSEFGKLHPQVDFKVRYGYAPDVNDALLSGELDFAFVDDYSFDNHIQTQKIYTEILTLCASKEYIKKHKDKGHDQSYFESLEYIKFQDNEQILSAWFKHHYGFNNLNLNIRSTLMNIDGASRLITSGLGAGILPKYMATRLKERGYDIHIFKGKKKTSKELLNPISIAWVKNKTRTYATEELIKFLRQKLKSYF